jgi:CAAX prenyl protease-like protein
LQKAQEAPNFSDMIALIVPFALYLVLSQISTQFPNYYPYFYTVSVTLVGAVTFILLRGRSIVKMHLNIAPGVIFGIVGIVAWILICRLQLEQSIIRLLPEWLQSGERASFNPFRSIDSTLGQWGFVGIRLLGLAVLVPVIEEVFWRGFLLRWIISPDWQDQEIGVFSLKSFLWVTFLFTLAHPEWIAAAVYCSLLNILLYWKRDLWVCIVAHGTSNLLLGIYVIYYRTWELW